MDRVAYACAAKYCQKDVVTISIDEVLFKLPIFVREKTIEVVLQKLIKWLS